jgi:mannose-6-phosphate isomerase-like protein (cupin superfamily)
MTTETAAAAGPETTLVGIDFEALPWEKSLKAGAHGRVKTAHTQGFRIRLLELPVGFDEQEWCTRGHQGYVLRGEFTIHFDDRSVACRPGMGFVIPGAERHRSSGSGTEETVVYVIDEVAAP